MKVIVQRSLASKVEVEGKIVGAIDQGLVLFVCLEKGDTIENVQKAINKVSALRIFKNQETHKMCENISYVKGCYLCISQFTLSWDGAKGNRPSFDNSMPPQEAKGLFNSFCEGLSKSAQVETGEFGASMKVSIENDGPVTFSFQF